MKEVAKYGFRASLVLLVATSAFNLGRYSVEFSGRPVAWTALVLSVNSIGYGCLSANFHDDPRRTWRPKMKEAANRGDLSLVVRRACPLDSCSFSDLRGCDQYNRY